MAQEFQMTLGDIKIQLADAVLEAAHLRRELAAAHKIIEKLSHDNSVHKRMIEQMHGKEAVASDQN